MSETILLLKLQIDVDKKIVSLPVTNVSDLRDYQEAKGRLVVASRKLSELLKREGKLS
jgi:hypothetical protein